MLLQNHGKLPAWKLAAELEVSVRTIYRDVEALSAAGVPVYAERGPGGGVALVDSYRTNLTGLNADEARALFMLNIPAPLTDLGVGRELKAALLKLTAALPSGSRQDEGWVRGRIHLDSSWWFQDEPAPQLQKLYQAVLQDRKLAITYRHEHFSAVTEREVEPYGLAAKARVWYLVAARQGWPRVYRVGRVLQATLLEERFERPAGFDLPAFWERWCQEFERGRSDYPVRVRVSPALTPLLPLYFGDSLREQLTQTGPPDERGWLPLTLNFESLETARDRLLAFGRALEVLEPEPLRLSLIDVAEQVVEFYRERNRRDR